jgi:hypothetical protein
MLFRLLLSIIQSWFRRRWCVIVAATCRDARPPVRNAALRSLWQIQGHSPAICEVLLERYDASRSECMQQTQQHLNRMLVEPMIPSWPEITKRLGLSKSSLFKCFPEQCAAVTKRHELRKREAASALKTQLTLEVGNIMSELHLQGKGSSLKRVRSLLPPGTPMYWGILQEVYRTARRIEA